MKKRSPLQAREKILHYCAYQERSHQEVRSKLFGFGLYSSEVEQIISNLITEGFLNEERFAKAFAGGKFRMKKWGRIKITHALEAKGISKNCIRIGLKEIEEKMYEEVLLDLLKTKFSKILEENLYSTRDRLSKYAISKGYEPELVWRKIHDLIPA